MLALLRFSFLTPRCLGQCSASFVLDTGSIRVALFSLPVALARCFPVRVFRFPTRPVPPNHRAGTLCGYFTDPSSSIPLCVKRSLMTAFQVHFSFSDFFSSPVPLLLSREEFRFLIVPFFFKELTFGHTTSLPFQVLNCSGRGDFPFPWFALTFLLWLSASSLFRGLGQGNGARLKNCFPMLFLSCTRFPSPGLLPSFRRTEDGPGCCSSLSSPSPFVN